MKLYHGSNQIIENPQFGFGNKRNDYGLGFYCTKSLEMAYEWSVGRGTDGFANEYEFDEGGLKVLNLQSVEYCPLHWLTMLLENRTFEIRAPLALEARSYLTNSFHIDITDIDVIEGHRADDSYFTFAQDFICGTISYRQLCQALHLGKLGRQVVIKSSEAFEKLHFIDSHRAARDVWLPRREERDRKARRDYYNVEKSKRRRADLFIMQIIDEEIGPDDARL